MIREIVKVKFGSHLYGTNTPTSDTDYKGVFIPNRKDIILQKPIARGVISRSTKADGSVKNSAGDVDDESFSLMKFMDMLRVGDMIASELLFAPPQNLIETSPTWEEIVSVRHRLLNKQIRGFVGYCQKQAAKYGIKGSRVATMRAALALVADKPNQSEVREYADEILHFISRHEHTKIVAIEQPSGLMLQHWEVCDRKIPYTVSTMTARNILQKVFDNYGHRALLAETNQGVDWKAMSHAVRVGEQAIELVTTGHITFPRPNAEELLAIKQGAFPYKEIAPRLEQLLLDVEQASAKSELPEHPDLKFMEDLVFDTYELEVVPIGL